MTDGTQASEGLHRVGRRPRQSRSEHPSIQPGKTLGDFRLVRFIDHGGMGQVWEAEQLSLGRRVALKLLLTGQALSEKQLATFRQEAMAGGRSRHPSIVAVLAYGEVEGIPFIAQELVGDGWTLADVIDERRKAGDLQPGWYRELAEFFAATADAMASVHALGVTHRDLKPSNILIGDDERPMVADFGLAKVAGEATLSASGDLAGTYRYMSPEQLLAKRIGIDHQTDVFSLGATLYEALTLERAFDGDTLHQISERVIFHDPPEPRSLRSKVPRDLSVICVKALQKRRSDRYADMQAFADDLWRWLKHEPIVAQPPGLVDRALKWTRRHPVVSAASAVAIVALSVMAWMQWQLGVANEGLVAETDRANSQAALAQGRATELVSVNAALENERDGVLRLAYSSTLQAADLARIRGVSYEARQLLKQCDESLRGWEWHHLWLSVHQAVQVLVGHRATARHVEWSPGGGRLASSGSRSDVWLWDGVTGAEIARLTYEVGGEVEFSWSPDGARIATASAGDRVRLFNAEDGSELWSLSPDENTAEALDFSPDGGLLATSSKDGTVFLRDGQSGESLSTLEGHSDEVTMLTFSLDGNLLASSSKDQTVRVWDVATGQPLDTLANGSVSMAWSPDGSRLAMGTSAGLLSFWDVVSRQVTHPFGLREGSWLYSVDWSPDGEQLAVSSSPANNPFEAEVSLWETGSGRQLGSLEVDLEAVFKVIWSPDGARLATASSEGTVRLWDAATWQPLSTLHGDDDYVWDVTWSPDGERLASASSAGPVLLWDADTGEASVKLAGHDAGVGTVAWSADGSRMASRDYSGELRLWDGENGALIAVLAGAEHRASDFAFSPDGSRLAFGSKTGSLHLLEAGSGTLLATSEGHEDGITSVAWSPDGSAFATAATDGTLGLWDGSSGQSMATLAGHSERANAVAWSADGQRLASASDDKTVRVWNVASGALLTTLEGHTGSVSSVAWSPTGNTLASGADDTKLRLWDGITGESLAVREADGWLSLVAWSPDGSRLLSAGWGDGTSTRLWDARDQTLIAELPYHRALLMHMTWSPDGTRLASAAEDGKVRLWNGLTGERLITLEGPEDEINQVAWGPDGTKLATGSDDGSLRVWFRNLEDARPYWHEAERLRRAR